MTQETNPISEIQYIGKNVCVATAAGAVGFYSQTPVAQQTISPPATDLDSALVLINEMRAALIALGLVREA
jgi:hypothetical protein